MGSIFCCSIPVIERDMTRICIIAIKDKKMGFIHINWVYFVYIMSSHLRRYSVLYELDTLDACRQRSMSGLIVVDAGRSRSTCLEHDSYIHDHCLGYRHNYSLFYQLPNSNLFTHCMLCSREKPLVKTMALGSILIIY